MKTLRLILGDQLSLAISSLDHFDINNDVIMLCEVAAEATYVKHHQLKIAFLFSAMRHFAQALIQKKYKVHYVKVDDPDNNQDFSSELIRAANLLQPDKIVVTESGEFRVDEIFAKLKDILPCPLEIKIDNRFYCSREEFKIWAADKNHLLMENFYRHMRSKHHILMDIDNTPIGGKWNFDKENRKPLKESVTLPDRLHFKSDSITQEVLALTKTKFGNHFGNLDNFYFAVTRAQAVKLLNHFIEFYLPKFGDYQDAMAVQSPFLFHSVLSPYLNCGLLSPQEVCEKAEQAYHDKTAPLNAVEGFIRQILGWREYMRGVYWLKMPEYATNNYLAAKRSLPSFYWTGNTSMRCLKSAITDSMNYAYSHHIQRLMITGNFALLAGITPAEVCEWYLIVYADAYEWVELPNTLGMSLFGDGGFIASKPYAASGNYINKMSNFCGECQYKPNLMLGETACPFNSLYWHFLTTNRAKLANNMRLKFPYATWDKMDSTKRQQILEQANKFLTTHPEMITKEDY